MGLVGGAPRIGIGQYFAAHHLWAARLMALRCREREDQLVAAGQYGVDYEVRSFALAAISESVALLEAHVNEAWQDTHDADHDDTDVPRLRGLEPPTRARLREQWTEQFEKRSALDKYAIALECAGKRLEKGRPTYQDVKAVTQLRHALAHFQPGMRWSDAEHRIETQVKRRAAKHPNPLMRDTTPWFPNHPLCAGVAEWAWRSCMKFADEWHEQMGLEISYRDGIAQWPDER